MIRRQFSSLRMSGNCSRVDLRTFFVNSIENRSRASGEELGPEEDWNERSLLTPTHRGYERNFSTFRSLGEIGRNHAVGGQLANSLDIPVLLVPSTNPASCISRIMHSEFRHCDTLSCVGDNELRPQRPEILRSIGSVFSQDQAAQRRHNPPRPLSPSRGEAASSKTQRRGPTTRRMKSRDSTFLFDVRATSNFVARYLLVMWGIKSMLRALSNDAV